LIINIPPDYVKSVSFSTAEYIETACQCQPETGAPAAQTGGSKGTWH